MIQLNSIDKTWEPPSIAGGDSAERARIKHCAMTPHDVLDAAPPAANSVTTGRIDPAMMRVPSSPMNAAMAPQLYVGHGLQGPSGRASRREVDAAKLARLRVQALEEDHCDGEGQRRER